MQAGVQTSGRAGVLLQAAAGEVTTGICSAATCGVAFSGPAAVSGRRRAREWEAACSACSSPKKSAACTQGRSVVSGFHIA